MEGREGLWWGQIKPGTEMRVEILTPLLPFPAFPKILSLSLSLPHCLPRYLPAPESGPHASVQGGERRAEKNLPVIAVRDPGPAGRSLRTLCVYPGPAGRSLRTLCLHCKENGLTGRADGGVGRRGWDTRRESHGNVCTTIHEIESRWDFAVSLRELKRGSVTT